MPFRHSHDEPSPGSDASPGSTDATAQLAATIARYAGLSAAAQAAEVLNEISTKLGERAGLNMDQLLPDLLPPLPPTPIPDQYLADLESLHDTIWQAFHALVLARLVYPEEQNNNLQGTDVFYQLSSDGRAALSQGNAAEVIARRLPD